MTLSSPELAKISRKSILRMTSSANASHVGSCLSVVDILAVLYAGVASITPNTTAESARDRIIVSKGHAAAAVYSVLAHAGYLDPQVLDKYCSNGALLGGHVTSHGVNGVEFSTGSLGHGLPLGVGVAMGLKIDSSVGRVFVVASDGELDEGSTWEAVLFASHHNLNNVTLIIDRNGLQSLTTTEETLALEPIDEKFRSFGWDVSTVDGHNHNLLRQVLGDFQSRPKVIIAQTTKGKGVSFMENQVLWHYRPPSLEQVELACTEIDGQLL